MSDRRQTVNGYDTKFKVQGGMKVDLPDAADLARQGKDLLREAQMLAAANQQYVDVVEGSAEQEMLYNSRITALSALATAHFTAASYYWEDR